MEIIGIYWESGRKPSLFRAFPESWSSFWRSSVPAPTERKTSVPSVALSVEGGCFGSQQHLHGGVEHLERDRHPWVQKDDDWAKAHGRCDALQDRESEGGLTMCGADDEQDLHQVHAEA